MLEAGISGSEKRKTHQIKGDSQTMKWSTSP